MPGSNYLVARSLDRATDESSSARRVSSNGSEAARLTTHPTDDPLLVARPTSARLIRRPSLSPRGLSPASLLSRWKRFQVLSRSPSVIPAESSAILRPPSHHPSFQEPANVQRVKQSRRSCSDRRRLLPNSTPASPPTAQTARSAPRHPFPAHHVHLLRPRQHSIPQSNPNEAPSEQ